MKKLLRIILFLALICILSVCVIVVRTRGDIQKKAAQQSSVIPTVTLTIDEGTKIATYSGVIAKTAYDALTQTAGQHNIQVLTKKYDFGILVQSIDGKENTTALSWIYFVNGKSGDVGADAYILHPGDMVEWKYIHPIF